MLKLDDPRWQSLTHAYGSAGDVPDMLRLLAKSARPTTAYDEEPWFSLWSSLCHQDDVYDASYAAMPHIVAIALDADWPIAFDFFTLPAAIEVARWKKRGPPVPADLQNSYDDALRSLRECVLKNAVYSWDGAMTQAALCALSASKGQTLLAEALLNLDDNLIEKLANLDF